MSPSLATVGWIVANVLLAPHGQAKLNAYWRRSRSSNVPVRVHWGEWAGLAAVSVIVTLSIGGAALESRNPSIPKIGSTVVVNAGPDDSLIGYAYLLPYPYESGVLLDRVEPGDELRISSASGYTDFAVTDSATGITYWHVVISYSGVEGWIDAYRLTIAD